MKSCATAAEFRCSMTAFVAGCRIREVRVARAEPAEAFAVSIALSFCFEMKVLSLILVLLGSCALAQEPLPILSGSWTASLASGQIFRGTWSGQTSRQNLNAALGSWTLLNEAGEIILEGTWSARKMGQGWQGTWTSRARKGAPLSGTWNADLPSFSGKTIQAMLERTAEREVAGSWRTRGYQGNWWLKGLPRH
jgi:hypothetical protein